MQYVRGEFDSRSTVRWVQASSSTRWSVREIIYDEGETKANKQLSFTLEVLSVIKLECCISHCSSSSLPSLISQLSTPTQLALLLITSYIHRSVARYPHTPPSSALCSDNSNASNVQRMQRSSSHQRSAT